MISCNFNSIKVQLKPPKGQALRKVLIFQFHKGTIKTSCDTCRLLLRTYFNSIKVQLKPQALQPGVQTRLFQFHKGTIKTHLCFRLRCNRNPFQFHKGTIKTHNEAKRFGVS